jgi:hypothetical protein
MNTYSVKVRKVSDTEPGAFQSIAKYIETDLIENTADYEVYEVRSERDITSDLDRSDGVISYEKIA